jgi:hypothetical protein
MGKWSIEYLLFRILTANQNREIWELVGSLDPDWLLDEEEWGMRETKVDVQNSNFQTLSSTTTNFQSKPSFGNSTEIKV